MLYMISYDLTRRDQEYDELWEALELLGAHRVLRSQWLLSWPGSATGLHAQLQSLINPNDRLLVNALGEHAWTNLLVDPDSVE